MRKWISQYITLVLIVLLIEVYIIALISHAWGLFDLLLDPFILGFCCYSFLRNHRRNVQIEQLTGESRAFGACSAMLEAKIPLYGDDEDEAE